MEGLLRTLVKKQHSALVAEVTRRYEAKQWRLTSAQVENLVFDTICCLFCKAKHPELELSLPPLLDKLWHMMLLQTRAYAALCQDLGGAFVHHSTVTEQDPVSVKRERCQRLIVLYRQLFDKHYTVLGAHWELEAEEQTPAAADAAAGKRPRDVSYEPASPTYTPAAAIKPTITFKELDGVITVKDYHPDWKVDRYLAFFGGDEARFIHSSRQLTEGLTMKQNGISPGVTIHVVKRLRGC